MSSSTDVGGSSSSTIKKRKQPTSLSSSSLLSEEYTVTLSENNITSYGTIENERIKPINDIFDPIIEKQLVRKLDIRMLTWAFFACFAKKLDRNNLQNAFTMGMDEDLDLNSSIYNWSLTMFFIGYIILQIPGNIIITKLPPRLVLPSFVILWGSVVCFMAIVQDFKGLWLLRFCLGLAEAPFYPGMIFLFGSWYTKDELGKRIAFFSTGNEISAAAGGLVAGVIYDNLHGYAGLPGWKWLFIIEGLIAVILGIIGFSLLPNFPDDSTTYWLTRKEREHAILRIQRQGIKQVSFTNAYSWKTVVNVLGTPYSWLLVINSSCLIFCTYLQLNFAIILRDTGFPVSFSNYMQTPLFIFAAITAVAIGWSSDRKKDRAFHIAGLQIWVGLWYLLLLSYTARVSYRSDPIIILFIVFVGTYAIAIASSLPSLCLAWANEIYKSDQNTRAVAIAFINVISNLAPSFVGIKMWVVTDSPDFWLGKLGGMIAAFISVIITVLIWSLLRINFMVPKSTSGEKGDIPREEEEIVPTEETPMLI
ncbi:major facilitator superfamily domain-containing protein [Circinella umbellata]|nr:major facilitator superfamily domain-containing protein [Circinella umbellata]